MGPRYFGSQATLRACCRICSPFNSFPTYISQLGLIVSLESRSLSYLTSTSASLTALQTMSDTISLPSIILLGTILFFAIRYFVSSASPSSTSSSGRSGPGGRRVDVSKVDQVSQMFPQLDRRAIAWDLSRNGGNVGATTERLLEGRGLEDVSPVLFFFYFYCRARR